MSDLSARVSPIFVEEAFDCARRAGLDGVEIARKCACPPELEEMTLKDYGRFWFALAQEIEDALLDKIESDRARANQPFSEWVKDACEQKLKAKSAS